MPEPSSDGQTFAAHAAEPLADQLEALVSVAGAGSAMARIAQVSMPEDSIEKRALLLMRVEGDGIALRPRAASRREWPGTRPRVAASDQFGAVEAASRVLGALLAQLSDCAAEEPQESRWPGEWDEIEPPLMAGAHTSYACVSSDDMYSSPPRHSTAEDDTDDAATVLLPLHTADPGGGDEDLAAPSLLPSWVRGSMLQQLDGLPRASDDARAGELLGELAATPVPAASSASVAVSITIGKRSKAAVRAGDDSEAIDTAGTAAAPSRLACDSAGLSWAASLQALLDPPVDGAPSTAPSTAAGFAGVSGTSDELLNDDGHDGLGGDPLALEAPLLPRWERDGGEAGILAELSAQGLSHCPTLPSPADCASVQSREPWNAALVKGVASALGAAAGTPVTPLPAAVAPTVHLGLPLPIAACAGASGLPSFPPPLAERLPICVDARLFHTMTEGPAAAPPYVCWELALPSASMPLGLSLQGWVASASRPVLAPFEVPRLAGATLRAPSQAAGSLSLGGGDPCDALVADALGARVAAALRSPSPSRSPRRKRAREREPEPSEERVGGGDGPAGTPMRDEREPAVTAVPSTLPPSPAAAPSEPQARAPAACAASSPSAGGVAVPEPARNCDPDCASVGDAHGCDSFRGDPASLAPSSWLAYCDSLRTHATVLLRHCGVSDQVPLPALPPGPLPHPDTLKPLVAHCNSWRKSAAAAAAQLQCVGAGTAADNDSDLFTARVALSCATLLHTLAWLPIKHAAAAGGAREYVARLLGNPNYVKVLADGGEVNAQALATLLALLERHDSHGGDPLAAPAGAQPQSLPPGGEPAALAAPAPVQVAAEPPSAAMGAVPQNPLQGHAPPSREEDGGARTRATGSPVHADPVHRPEGAPHSDGYGERSSAVGGAEGAAPQAAARLPTAICVRVMVGEAALQQLPLLRALEAPQPAPGLTLPLCFGLVERSLPAPIDLQLSEDSGVVLLSGLDHMAWGHGPGTGPTPAMRQWGHGMVLQAMRFRRLLVLVAVPQVEPGRAPGSLSPPLARALQLLQGACLNVPDSCAVEWRFVAGSDYAAMAAAVRGFALSAVVPPLMQEAQAAADAARGSGGQESEPASMGGSAAVLPLLAEAASRPWLYDESDPTAAQELATEAYLAGVPGLNHMTAARLVALAGAGGAGIHRLVQAGPEAVASHMRPSLDSDAAHAGTLQGPHLQRECEQLIARLKAALACLGGG